MNFVGDKMNPTELKYSKDHEWAKVEGDIVIVGITDFAQKQLTDIVFVELPEKGKQVEANKQMAVVESVKSVSEINVPVSGKIIRINEKIEDSPELINKSPYDAGWLVEIEIKDLQEIDDLLDSKSYEKSIVS